MSTNSERRQQARGREEDQSLLPRCWSLYLQSCLYHIQGGCQVCTTACTQESCQEAEHLRSSDTVTYIWPITYIRTDIPPANPPRTSPSKELLTSKLLFGKYFVFSILGQFFHYFIESDLGSHIFVHYSLKDSFKNRLSITVHNIPVSLEYPEF